MRLRFRLYGAVAAAISAAALAPGVQAVPFASTAPTPTSGSSPFVGCVTPPGPGPGVNHPGSEVEPYVDVNPVDPDNIVGFYQQDRWSNGGAKGNVASITRDGGATWTQVVVPVGTVCSASGDFERASDPWVSFGPTGWAHAMSLVTDTDPTATGGFGDNGMTYNRSKDGGLTWEAPIYLKVDTDPRFFNDKNTITADPNDEDYVYAVWGRLTSPRGGVVAAPQGRENIFGLGFRGPAWFTRTTDGGDTFEPARIIYDPKGANNQTIGNQIAVLPASEGGDVLNFFNEIVNFRNAEGGGQFEFNLSLIRSTDKGTTWTSRATRITKFFPMDRVREDGVIDSEPVPCPDPGDAGSCPIRTGDVLFDVAVDGGDGTLYAVVQDARFSGFGYDTIALTRSTDGGATWSPLVRLNAGSDAGARPDDRQAFTPAVHVGDDGTVTVTFYDFRNNTATDGILATDHWAVHCHAASADCSQAASWDDETRITPTSFDMRQAPFARGYFTGDYEGLSFARDDGDAIGPTADVFVSYFSQPHGGDPSSAFSSLLAP
ncbi:MAG: sialidase family protein [Acidimicrobiales bacterium]